MDPTSVEGIPLAQPYAAPILSIAGCLADVGLGERPLARLEAALNAERFGNPVQWRCFASRSPPELEGLGLPQGQTHDKRRG